MPTYEYKCDKCGNIFEKFQNMTDSPLKKCPECKGRIRRIISGGASVIFKGGGFYQTDYKGSASGSSEKTASSDTPKTCPNADKCSACG